MKTPSYCGSIILLSTLLLTLVPLPAEALLPHSLVPVLGVTGSTDSPRSTTTQHPPDENQPQPSLSEGPRLIFTFDGAGNQTRQEYQGVSQKALSDAAAQEQPTTPENQNQLASREDYEQYLVVAPNPTRGRITVRLESELRNKVQAVRIYRTDMVLLKELDFEHTDSATVDLTGPPGMYFVNAYLNDGTRITKKIIKN